MNEKFNKMSDGAYSKFKALSGLQKGEHNSPAPYILERQLIRALKEKATDEFVFEYVSSFDENRVVDKYCMGGVEKDLREHIENITSYTEEKVNSLLSMLEEGDYYEVFDRVTKRKFKNLYYIDQDLRKYYYDGEDED